MDEKFRKNIVKNAISKGVKTIDQCNSVEKEAFLQTVDDIWERLKYIELKKRNRKHK